MVYDDEDKIIDAEYEEASDTTEKKIRGSILYYSTSQVATMLGETDSKIRYYTTIFDDILHIEVSNKQRRYKDNDIEKLKFIIELKSTGMSLKQIKSYCSEVEYDTDNGIQVKESNPLSIQTLAKALMEEQSKQLQKFKESLLEEFKEQIKEGIVVQQDIMSQTKEEICLSVDEVVDSKLQQFSDKIDETMVGSVSTINKNILGHNDTITKEVKELKNNIEEFKIAYVTKEEINSSRESKIKKIIKKIMRY